MKKTYCNWSSGKDSALALYKVLQDPKYNVALLVTTINKDFNRISMHGLRNELLFKQVEAIGIDLKTIEFPAEVEMDEYAEIMREATASLVVKGYSHSVFGDIFLEDLKAYRDVKLSEAQITGVYPLWKQNTKEILQEFLVVGFKAITVCVNAKVLGKEFVGRYIDLQFIEDLPENVDVCGENGEFHTFVFDGPIFKNPIDFVIGKKVLRSHTFQDTKENNQQFKKEKSNHDTQFWYCDLI
ncbi:hypothetical protein PI23P_09015 [Polaribacter irgensii 23-P]|uniref:Diphthamide synthase domain-containing protein n=1 Tax=Polaribacter irgensii 23-P TaxID=313594 RepID=A4C012_9FLAO|nr:diphthine--ammonia ligase [Polaribacter irgensii]EAR12755.1 hypothetical protein PI23P_09015 [Polaribacter irgensii 23-P]